MKISTLATLAAFASLALSTTSHAAWFAKYDGVKGSIESTTQFKKVDGFKVEQGVIEEHSTRSSKPKEIVVVGSKPAKLPKPAKTKR